MYKRFIGLACLVWFGCQENFDNPLRDFEDINEVILLGEEMRLQSETILFRPHSFQVYDSLAIFNDNTGEAGFSIIDLNSGQLIKKFAFSGSDESELNINAITMENGTVNYDSVFSITEENRPHRVFRYHWDSLLTSDDYRPNPMFFYPEEVGFSHTYFLNDSILFGKLSTVKLDNNSFGLLNISSNKLRTGVNVPGSINSHLNGNRDSLYFRFLNIRMDNRVAYRPGSSYEFACLSHKGAVIQIISVDQNYRIEKKYEKVYYLPTFNLLKGPNFSKIVAGENSKVGFRSMDVNDENIFALFNGPLLNESEENIDLSDIVLVFDWNGNPKKRIRLDRRVRQIAADRDNFEAIYGLTDSLQIIKYILPKEE